MKAKAQPKDISVDHTHDYCETMICLDGKTDEQLSRMGRQQALMDAGCCPNCDPPIELTRIDYRTYACRECKFVGYGSFGKGEDVN